MYGTEPYYGTYDYTLKNSEIPRVNTFPYPFYFVGNPVTDEPNVYLRRAGWSKEHVKGKSPVKPDRYPKHCFQASCKTTYTELVPEQKASGSGGSTGGKSGGGCSRSSCINLYR